MNNAHLTDRMPDVRLGCDTWTAADRDHLDFCAACAAEWQVVAGVRVAKVDAVDADAVAAGVLRRLREEPAVLPLRRGKSWRIGLMGLAAAASVALAVMVWGPMATDQHAMVPVREPTMLPELDALLEAELEEVLAYIAPMRDEPLGTVPRIGDLTDEEVELLLAEVEG